MDNTTQILVNKQTILPLVEYVSFMLCLDSARDIEKLQKLQMRSLRLYLDIYKPMELCLRCVHLWGVSYRVRGKFLSLTRTKVKLLTSGC